MNIEREEIEWTNSWIQDANNYEKKRILLIGDSVTRQIRKPINSLLIKHNISVDLFACSYTIFDKRYIHELKYFFCDDYKYDHIIFMDVHHRTTTERCCEDSIIEAKFRERIQSILEYLKSCIDSVFVCTSTPYQRNYSSENEELLYRNDILKQIVLGEGIIDLWSFINEDIIYTDHVHFDNAYNLSIASFITNHLYEDVKIVNFPTVVDSDGELKEITANKDIIVYGYGEKGRILYKFLSEKGVNVRITVSDDYYKKSVSVPSLVRLDDLRGCETILITIYDVLVERDIVYRGLKYFFISSDLLNLIKERYI